MNLLLISHIIFNLIFFMFCYFAIAAVKNIKLKESKFEKNLMIVCFICGMLGYILYLVVAIDSLLKGDFFAQSFSLLITSWAFMLAVERIYNKK
nr:hypothetical protein [uncultured Cellulosilyticum sp.]